MLTNGIALYNTAMNLMRIIIPVIAGTLVLVIGVAGVYYIGAACYAVSIVALLMIPASRKAGPRPDSSVGRDLIEGLGYVRRSPIILILLVMAFVAAIFAMPYSNFMPVFAVDILEAGPTGLGWLLTMTGIGALAGSLGVASLANFRRKGLLLLISAIAFGAMLILFCFSHSFALSLLLLVGVGLGMACYMTLSNALIQQNTTHEVRGRVMSIYMMTFGLMPLGALPLGAIADRVGTPSTLSIAAAIATTFIVLMAILRPQLRRLE